MDDIMEDKSEIDDNASDFLPDLTEEKTFEQICFDKKVNKANERFLLEKTPLDGFFHQMIIAPILNQPKVTNTHSSKMQRSILMIAS